MTLSAVPISFWYRNADGTVTGASLGWLDPQPLGQVQTFRTHSRVAEQDFAALVEERGQIFRRYLVEALRSQANGPSPARRHP
jgi:hypothetical protein